MTKLLIAGFALFVALQPAFAQDEMASAATIRDLLAVTKMHALLDGQRAQLEERMRLTFEKAFSKKSLNVAQQEVLVKKQKELVAIVSEAVGYEVLEPVAIDIYRKALTQREAESLLTFYKSEAGQAVIEKMPLVLQQVMNWVQGATEKMQPKIEQWQRDTADELRAARGKGI